MPELHLSQNALAVLEARYLRRDSARRITESADELFARVAQGVANAELLLHSARQASFWREEYHRILTSLDFLPNSPTLMNAGTPAGQLNACFVLPVEDTMEDIFEAIKQMALVQRTGGGTGFSFSHLRPAGDVVASTGGEASGPVSFMQIFDCATEHIKQGGKRRGANMGVLRVDHPDIVDFINTKLEADSLRNFNISIGVTDEFMQAARGGDAFGLVHPVTGNQVGTLQASEVLQAIVQAAWRTGDPGLLFLDAIGRSNPTPDLGKIEATNPCGEIPLLPHEACTLGSINLANMVRDAGGGPAVDWERLQATTRTAVRFLDDVLEVSRYPIPEIERMVRGNRKIGLGVMGFAEMLVHLGVSYDSDQALVAAEEVMEFIHRQARQSSRELAGERGVFPFWKSSRFAAEGVEMRNATCTAIAPTGTISIIAGTSASIEPLFALAYRRTGVLNGQSLYEINPLFLEGLKRHGLDSSEFLGRIWGSGSLRQVPEAPERLRHLFPTALDIPLERHLQIQAAFQRHVDNSVSKTINLPEEATPDDVARAYWLAWEMGLKGITVFRYGSKGSQVLELGQGEESYHYDHASKCDPAECRL